VYFDYLNVIGVFAAQPGHQFDKVRCVITEDNTAVIFAKDTIG